MNPKFKDILIRYAILILVAIPGIYFFYFIFTSLTIYPVYFILSLFYNTSLVGTTIMVSKNLPIELIGACIAGSAYHLLFILNLTTPKIKVLKRIRMILVSFLIFLIINVLRIILLSMMFISNSSGLEITHKILWYFGSTIFIMVIWFWEVKHYKVKEIPFYSDIKFVFRKTKRKRK